MILRNRKVRIPEAKELNRHRGHPQRSRNEAGPDHSPTRQWGNIDMELNTRKNPTPACSQVMRTIPVNILNG